MTKPIDTAAAEICFGVEIETMIPYDSGVSVGGYHRGTPVTSGRSLASGQVLVAPVLAPRDAINVRTWRADRDGSIRVEQGFEPCEFVSPILKGEAGLVNLCAMLEFITAIGGKVNASCGLHITVGIKSIIGTNDLPAIKAFIRKIGHVANQNAWAIYAQTSEGRHQNSYSAMLSPTCAQHLSLIASPTTPVADLTTYAAACGRGMVNLQKAFITDREAIEFRAFSGTLDRATVLHHLATVLGLVRRAAVSQVIGGF
ncbi:MAG: amidoligase family protein [Gammaproteobacteria bacterium]|nr:amidoligase family protein [Gammaproteobacteria bacterium]